MEIIDMELLNLPAKLTALIEDIEARSPRPLSFVDYEYTNCVYVFLEVPEGLRHEVICHEVLHFQYYLDGFPMIDAIAGCPDYDDGTIIATLSDITITL
jgi:hypothetical protein